MANLRLIHGDGDDRDIEGNRQLVGMFDTEEPENGWFITRRGMEKIWMWAEEVPTIILFHFNVDLEI